MSLVPCVLEAIYNITFNFNKKKKKKKEKNKRKKEEIKKRGNEKDGWEGKLYLANPGWMFESIYNNLIGQVEESQASLPRTISSENQTIISIKRG